MRAEQIREGCGLTTGLRRRHLAPRLQLAARQQSGCHTGAGLGVKAEKPINPLSTAGGWQQRRAAEQCGIGEHGWRGAPRPHRRARTRR